jgi:enamine deaminase RidA (YjgF/YER057c/UK114 family)
MVSDPLEHIAPQGRFKGNVPLSPAVKIGKHVFVSGVPGYDLRGTLAIGDFPAQMKQVMDNITAILEASGTGWDRVARTKVFLTRATASFSSVTLCSCSITSRHYLRRRLRSQKMAAWVSGGK